MREHLDDVRCGLYGQLQSDVILCGPWDTSDATVPHTTRPDGSPPLFLLLFTGNYQRATARSPQKSLSLACLRQKKQRKSAARDGRWKIDPPTPLTSTAQRNYHLSHNLSIDK